MTQGGIVQGQCERGGKQYRGDKAGTQSTRIPVTFLELIPDEPPPLLNQARGRSMGARSVNLPSAVWRRGAPSAGVRRLNKLPRCHTAPTTSIWDMKYPTMASSRDQRLGGLTPDVEWDWAAILARCVKDCCGPSVGRNVPAPGRGCLHGGFSLRGPGRHMQAAMRTEDGTTSLWRVCARATIAPRPSSPWLQTKQPGALPGCSVFIHYTS